MGDAIPASLTGMPGDAARGRAIVGNRQVGLCLLCHTGPFPEEKFQGTLAPDLKGAGARWSVGQLRLRIVDASRFKADTIMPAYYRVEGLTRVAPSFRRQARADGRADRGRGGVSCDAAGLGQDAQVPFGRVDPFPFVPAKAGTRGDSRDISKWPDSRLRGNERINSGSTLMDSDEG